MQPNTTLGGANSPQLIDAKALGKLFNPPRCERTIRNWQAARTVPFYKVGRSVFFNAVEVFEHLSKHNRVMPGGDQ